jgi:hypothetical protein
MRFSDQVRWSRKWGAILLLLSVISLCVLVLLRETVARDEVIRWGDLVNLFLAAAAVLLLFGGLMRPLQKKLYHAVFEPNENYRKRLAANPILRWFWWLDFEGRDRDA